MPHAGSRMISPGAGRMTATISIDEWPRSEVLTGAAACVLRQRVRAAPHQASPSPSRRSSCQRDWLSRAITCRSDDFAPDAAECTLVDRSHARVPNCEPSFSRTSR